jgi:hypothetical protein
MIISTGTFIINQKSQKIVGLNNDHQKNYNELYNELYNDFYHDV